MDELKTEDWRAKTKQFFGMTKGVLFWIETLIIIGIGLGVWGARLYYEQCTADNIKIGAMLHDGIVYSITLK